MFLTLHVIFDSCSVLWMARGDVIFVMFRLQFSSDTDCPFISTSPLDVLIERWSYFECVVVFWCLGSMAHHIWWQGLLRCSLIMLVEADGFHPSAFGGRAFSCLDLAFTFLSLFRI